MLADMTAYANFDPEVERRRLRLQAEMLEPLSDRMLSRLSQLGGDLRGKRALDVACGAMGLLGPLARRVGPEGQVVGSDVSDVMLDHARAYCTEHRLANVSLTKDDAYASTLPAASFDLVHARFLLAPVGRDEELFPQLERLVRPGGWVALEEPLCASWRVFPDGGAHDAVVAMVRRAYDRHMGGFDAGARLFDAARHRGWHDVGFDAQVLAMPPGHPLIRLPVLMAKAVRAVVLRDTPEAELDEAVAAAEELYARPATHGITFAIVQVWGRPSG
jgi:ubiquinone/menaquinone biosynthesis C-methylase UbiE